MLYLASAAVAADAEHPEENWITDSINGCRIWNPTPLENETVSWRAHAETGSRKAMG
jgi:hypothetical protein